MGVANNGVIVQRFTSKLEEMWKDNGNKISQNYAGTGALQGSKVIINIIIIKEFIIDLHIIIREQDDWKDFFKCLSLYSIFCLMLCFLLQDDT